MFRLIGGFISLSSEFCFVVEDENGIVGYAMAALDAKQFYKKVELTWIPELCEKYPKPVKGDGELLTPAEVRLFYFLDIVC